MNNKITISILAVLSAALFCFALIPADVSSADGIENDQGTVTYYTYTVNFQFQGTDAEWIIWDFGFNDSNGSKVTSNEWNPQGIVFPGKGTYVVVQTVGNTVGTYVSQLKINIMGTPEVTFESNGGSSVSMQTVKVGSKAFEPEQPVREGYTFAGWYKESSLLNRYSFDQPVSQHMTLYAKWTSVSGGTDGGDDQGGETGVQNSSVFYIGGVGIDNTVLSISIIVFGVLIAFVGDRRDCSRLIVAGVLFALVGAIGWISGVDIIGTLGLSGVRL